MRAERIQGYVQREFFFILLFNFMINEPSNDKIQGITLGVVAAAKMRITEAKEFQELRNQGVEL